MTMQIQLQQIQRTISIDDRTRGGLATILDVLLPGSEKLPPGRVVGAHLELLDKVLEADPRLEPVVTRTGELAAGSDTCTFADIGRWAGEDLEQLVFALHSAYYMSGEVRSALGYPGQARRPIALATPEEVCSDELVAPVLARGAVYVRTPE
ncbi:hypothetical protein [Streptomyces malaysiensis]|uniref:hypothetical protein n=1 Tax=Streptomyces malaysiensis TaxID=92644 RepID=UPI002B2B13D9|nr:hypothetical protein R8789_08350 [Streptomyces malaysiensis]